MKEQINYYYGMNIEEVEDWGKVYHFTYQDSLFYFVPFKRSEKELNDILKICQELSLKNIFCHEIIVNRFHKYLTNVYQENYILLRIVTTPDLEYDIFDMLKINQQLVLKQDNLKLYHNEWALMWSKKIDYFEYQVHELGKDKPFLLDTFSYYVGLAENAIAYLNVTISKYHPLESDKVVLSHKRVTYPNYALNYLNPLSFIFDLEVRDMAEYLKSSFFKGENSLNILESILKMRNYSLYSLNMLYARLLYPTYYFDIYEKIMNDQEKENALDIIVDKALDYEKFLKDSWYLLSKYGPIERIEWILIEKK